MDGYLASIEREGDLYMRERRKELDAYLDLFRKQLFHIHSIMPPPMRMLDLKTGEFSVVNDPEWQKVIDRITNEQTDFLKVQFPEFYKQDNK